MSVTTINLPTPKSIGKMSLEESISRRRSEREYAANELSMEQISQILWAAQGITDKDFGFRAAPSAGSLYPVSLYVLKKDGVFLYVPDGHKLIQTSAEDKRAAVCRAGLGQAALRDAPVVIAVAANFRITQSKYGQRAFRYVLMEIGHVAENIQLQAAALGLVSVPIGSFWDDVIAKTLELPETQDPLYLIPVGYLKNATS